MEVLFVSRGSAEALYAGETTAQKSHDAPERPTRYADTSKLLTDRMPSSHILSKDRGHVHGPVHEELIRLPIASEQIAAEEIRGSDIDRIVRESQVVQRML